MTVKELIERLSLAPQDADVERGDSDNAGDLIQTPIDKVEIILGEDYQSVIIY